MGDELRLLERFYAAFAARDGAGMAACYHPEARFADPVFPDLRGTEVGAMWRMLTERGKDLAVHSSDLWTDGDRGGARWVAEYTFSATGREVRNEVVSTFVFRDGLIVEHRDAFDLWRWTRMALGGPGVLLGWSPLVKGRVRRQAKAALDRFVERERVG